MIGKRWFEVRNITTPQHIEGSGYALFRTRKEAREYLRRARVEFSSAVVVNVSIVISIKPER